MYGKMFKRRDELQTDAAKQTDIAAAHQKLRHILLNFQPNPL
jgi:hypothetical protein